MKKDIHPVVKSEFCLLKLNNCIPTLNNTKIVDKIFGKVLH
jgi:hypothetical protein